MERGPGAEPARGAPGENPVRVEESSRAPDELDRALDEYLAHLRVERGLLPATLESYARDLGEYLRWLRDGRVSTLDQVAEERIFAHLASLQQRGLSAASQARHLAALRGLHRFAAAEGLARLDPSVNVGRPRLKRPLPNFLGVTEVDRLLAQPDPKTPAGARDKAMLELLYATGLRVSELVALPLAAIDPGTGVVRVRGKGNKERVIPVGERAREALAFWLSSARGQLLAKRTSRDLFVTPRGTRCTSVSALRSRRCPRTESRPRSGRAT